MVYLIAHQSKRSIRPLTHELSKITRSASRIITLSNCSFSTSHCNFLKSPSGGYDGNKLKEQKQVNRERRNDPGSADYLSSYRDIAHSTKWEAKNTDIEADPSKKSNSLKSFKQIDSIFGLDKVSGPSNIGDTRSKRTNSSRPAETPSDRDSVKNMGSYGFLQSQSNIFEAWGDEGSDDKRQNFKRESRTSFRGRSSRSRSTQTSNRRQNVQYQEDDHMRAPDRDSTEYSNKRERKPAYEGQRRFPYDERDREMAYALNDNMTKSKITPRPEFPNTRRYSSDVTNRIADDWFDAVEYNKAFEDKFGRDLDYLQIKDRDLGTLDASKIVPATDLVDNAREKGSHELTSPLVFKKGDVVMIDRGLDKMFYKGIIIGSLTHEFTVQKKLLDDVSVRSGAYKKLSYFAVVRIDASFIDPLEEVSKFRPFKAPSSNAMKLSVTIRSYDSNALVKTGDTVSFKFLEDESLYEAFNDLIEKPHREEMICAELRERFRNNEDLNLITGCGFANSRYLPLG